MDRVLRLSKLGESWPFWVPPLAAVALVFTWSGDLSAPAAVITGLLLAGAVLAAVHHAEVVAHRVGEPYGSLVLAIAVTVIEVGLILTLMLSKSDGSTSTLARDTVFAAAMITMNGIVGLSLLIGALRHRVPRFNAEGAGSALATVLSVAALSLVLPNFLSGSPQGQFTGPQLAFAAVASLLLWVLFVGAQTGAHRDFFLPVSDNGDGPLVETHADPPSDRAALTSFVVLVVALVAVVGLAKVQSPTIEAAVAAADLPRAVVGVAIALLVLAPESLAAVRAARRNRMQISLNLAYGSAMATIGLTVPVIAVATVWVDTPLQLGLGPAQMVLLLLTAVVSVLTLVPGRATRLEGAVHLTLFAAFLMVSVTP